MFIKNLVRRNHKRNNGLNILINKFCTAETNFLTNDYKETKTLDAEKNKVRRPTKVMQSFFNLYPELSDTLPHVPNKYFRAKSSADHNYLICAKIAKQIVDKVMPYLDLSGKQMICETNAGLGLITMELMERGVSFVRMYESCPEFQLELRDFREVYSNRVELHTKDLFLISRFAYMDKHDRLNRVENLFRDVPVRSWTDEPAMSVIGCMNGFNFLKHLVRSLALQTIPVTLGRLQIFALLEVVDFAILSATTKNPPSIYKNLTVLFNLIFDIQYLDAYQKHLFVPWMNQKHMSRRSLKSYDKSKRYLMRITFKKHLPVEADKLLHLLYFIKHFYRSGNACVLPKLEKWFPDVGYNLIHPKLKHEDYYENFNIYTRFRDLNPQQVLAVFKEVTNHPTYKESSFTEMIENELMHYETVESDMVDLEFESKLLEDFEENLSNPEE